jgi:hypothetical protein
MLQFSPELVADCGKCELMGLLVLSRFDAAPLIAFTAAKETNYGHRKNG